MNRLEPGGSPPEVDAHAGARRGELLIAAATVSVQGAGAGGCTAALTNKGDNADKGLKGSEKEEDMRV